MGMINKNTKITLGVILTFIAIAIPATVGFSSYLDGHVDGRIKPMIEQLKEMHKDIREIRSYLFKGSEK